LRSSEREGKEKEVRTENALLHYIRGKEKRSAISSARSQEAIKCGTSSAWNWADFAKRRTMSVTDMRKMASREVPSKKAPKTDRNMSSSDGSENMPLILRDLLIKERTLRTSAERKLVHVQAELEQERRLRMRLEEELAKHDNRSERKGENDLSQRIEARVNIDSLEEQQGILEFAYEQRKQMEAEIDLEITRSTNFGSGGSGFSSDDLDADFEEGLNS